MGFRHRKSINLGGGFKINLSKSGIGYSWGVKGYRITRTAKGRTRTTASIPGTGLSYVHESKKAKKRSSHRRINTRKKFTPEMNNYCDTQSIANNVASEMVSEGLEAMLASARKALRLKRVASIGFWIAIIFSFKNPTFLIFAVVFAIMFIYVKTRGRITLDYDIEADQQALIDSRMTPMIKIAACSKVWRIIQSSKIIDRKYAAGASSSVKRKSCATAMKAPFPFQTNIEVASFKLKKETLLFLPDKIFIIQGCKIGALNYDDITVRASTLGFIETSSIPKDAQVVGQTWKYVNKSGKPDKRFKHNKQLPVCRYGELALQSASGLNTVILYSNPDAA